MNITISDTRTAETDTSGSLIKDLLQQAGSFEIKDYRIVNDEYAHIQALVREAAVGDTVETVLINGGTGITRRDTTYEAVVTCSSKKCRALEKFSDISVLLKISVRMRFSAAFAVINKFLYESYIF
ncbi:molybdopterin-binding protein [Paenibacillus mendelii]|nr:molybdopterin-binding protein [Paenibacillus mendelii]